MRNVELKLWPSDNHTLLPSGTLSLESHRHVTDTNLKMSILHCSQRKDLLYSKKYIEVHGNERLPLKIKSYLSSQ